MIDGINDTRPRRRRARGPAAGRPRARQPDPDEPGRAHAVVGHADPRHRAVRRPAARGRHRDDDPESTAARRSARRAASWPPSTPASPRRSSSGAAASGWSPRAPRPCAASAATTRSRPGWGRLSVARPPAGGVQIAASILDCGPRGARRRDPARRGGRCGPDPPRRHGRPLRAQHHVRLEDHRGGPAGHRAPVRRPPDDLASPAAGRRPVPRRRLRLDHVPRRGRRAPGPADARARSARRAGRPGLSVKPGDAARGARRLPRPARHRARDDRRARVRRPGVHGGRRGRQARCRARGLARSARARARSSSTAAAGRRPPRSSGAAAPT